MLMELLVWDVLGWAWCFFWLTAMIAVVIVIFGSWMS